MENFEELDDKVPHLIKLTIVKTVLETMQKELSKFKEINELGYAISTIGDNVKLINDGINIQGIVREVLENQDWFKANMQNLHTGVASADKHR